MVVISNNHRTYNMISRILSAFRPFRPIVWTITLKSGRQIQLHHVEDITVKRAPDGTLQRYDITYKADAPTDAWHQAFFIDINEIAHIGREVL